MKLYSAGFYSKNLEDIIHGCCYCPSYKTIFDLMLISFRVLRYNKREII